MWSAIDVEIPGRVVGRHHQTFGLDAKSPIRPHARDEADDWRRSPERTQATVLASQCARRASVADHRLQKFRSFRGVVAKFRAATDQSDDLVGTDRNIASMRENQSRTSVGVTPRSGKAFATWFCPLSRALRCGNVKPSGRARSKRLSACCLVESMSVVVWWLIDIRSIQQKPAPLA